MSDHPLFLPAVAALLGAAVTLFFLAVAYHRSSRERTACYRCDTEMPEAGLCAKCRRKRDREEAEYLERLRDAQRRERERNA